MGKTAGKIKNLANSLLRNPMMLHPDRDQKLQILPLAEYPRDKRAVNKFKQGRSMESKDLLYLVTLKSCTKEKNLKKKVLEAFKRTRKNKD